jgi:hypothetical protein
LDVDYQIPGKIGALILTVERAESVSQLKISYRGKEIEPGDIEFWEKGNLVLKTPCKGIAQRPGYLVKSGVVLAIRPGFSEEGLNLLFSECEFSLTDWKAACLTACLEGDLAEALRICRQELRPALGESGRIERICGQISGLQALTRTEGFTLRPVLATRSLEVEREARLAAYEPVWRGILQCWPDAASLSNPWRCREDELQHGTSAPINLQDEVADLVQACFNATSQNTSPQTIASSCEAVQAVVDPDLQNGWVALRGWTHLLIKEYTEARKVFDSVEPVQGDPFSLALGARLAGHLSSAESEEPSAADFGGSSDTIWAEVFAPIL